MFKSSAVIHLKLLRVGWVYYVPLGPTFYVLCGCFIKFFFFYRTNSLQEFVISARMAKKGDYFYYEIELCSTYAA